jgi:hypothetical protein
MDNRKLKATGDGDHRTDRRQYNLHSSAYDAPKVTSSAHLHTNRLGLSCKPQLGNAPTLS